MLGTETLANRGSGAVRHGARLVLASTVRNAMRFFNSCQTSGATCKLALSICTMFLAKTACLRKSGAAFHLAHFCLASAVFATPSPCSNGCGAPFPRAGWFDTVLAAQPTSTYDIIASYSRAVSTCTMVRTKPFAFCVAAAAWFYTLPIWSMFLAQTSSCCFGGTAFH